MEKNQQNSLERLRDLVLGTSLRRTIALNSATLCLQARTEEVELVDLYHNDGELYRFFQQLSSDIASGSKNRKKKGEAKVSKDASTRADKGDNNILSLINFLRLICNYGERILPLSALEAWRARDADAIAGQMRQQASQHCAICAALLQTTVTDADTLPCGHRICSACLLARDEADDMKLETDDCRSCLSHSHSQPEPPPSGESLGRSAKVEALIRNLRKEQQPRAGGTRKRCV